MGMQQLTSMAQAFSMEVETDGGLHLTCEQCGITDDLTTNSMSVDDIVRKALDHYAGHGKPLAPVPQPAEEPQP
jgi:hypothetical protein